MGMPVQKLEDFAESATRKTKRLLGKMKGVTKKTSSYRECPNVTLESHSDPLRNSMSFRKVLQSGSDPMRKCISFWGRPNNNEWRTRQEILEFRKQGTIKAFNDTDSEEDRTNETHNQIDW